MVVDVASKVGKNERGIHERADGLGFKILREMGWKGEGLGKKSPVSNRVLSTTVSFCCDNDVQCEPILFMHDACIECHRSLSRIQLEILHLHVPERPKNACVEHFDTGKRMARWRR